MDKLELARGKEEGEIAGLIWPGIGGPPAQKRFETPR
jgi:hypothetical protein